MDLFNCSAEELAKEFAENEKLYENFYGCLSRLEGRMNPKINLEKTLEKVNAARNLCSEGRYFLFSVEDDYSKRGIGSGYGFELYKLVSGEMIEVIKTDQSVPQSEEIIKFLSGEGADKVYNPIFELAGKYSGAEGYDKDQDGDFKHINPLSSSDDLSEFLDAGIEIVGI